MGSGLEEKTMNHLAQIIAIAQAAAALSGNALANELVRIIGVAGAGYKEITGGPVDPALVPKIEPIE